MTNYHPNMAWPAEPPGRQPHPAPTGWRPGAPYAPGPPPVPPLEPAGVLWTGIPFMTFGLGSPVTFVYGGFRAKSRQLIAAGAGYGASYLVVFGLLFSGTGPAILLGVLLFLALWLTSSVHAVAVRRQVYPRRTPRDRANAHAVKMAQYRRGLREQARQLLAEDPALAVELCIGRPDLPRAYDDGGLIDVNHAPGPTLGLLPGMTDALVQRILKVRENQGGFVSAEEMGIDADLPPDVVQRISEYAIFIR